MIPQDMLITLNKNFVSMCMKFPLLAVLLCILPLRAQVDSWDLPPVKYSDTLATDRLSSIIEKWSKDPSSWKGKTPLERMRSVMAALHVPEASQILVYSKTSKQNGLIYPANPRAIYFSQDCYCGYVPGGVMEIAIEAPQLGPVYYVVDLGDATTPMRADRDTNDCLSCHGTGRTENVPGMLVRSVYPDEEGHPLLAQGSALITHQSPIRERWGGYYVTGKISLPHLGNRTYTDRLAAEPARSELKDLKEKIDTTRYACATSDIVALMVLEHQCQAHNLLTAASMNYKRAYYLGKAMDAAGNPDEGSAGRVADHSAAQIVDWFLFSDEATLGEDGVEGSEDFQKQFSAMFPRTSEGDSLADFQLNTRIFKNRCSYMIYSEAFKQLPERVKSAVIAGLKKVLESETLDDAHKDIKISERKRIAKILHETGIW
jgi:hypothetical protein